MIPVEHESQLPGQVLPVPDALVVSTAEVSTADPQPPGSHETVVAASSRSRRSSTWVKRVFAVLVAVAFDFVLFRVLHRTVSFSRTGKVIALAVTPLPYAVFFVLKKMYGWLAFVLAIDGLLWPALDRPRHPGIGSFAFLVLLFIAFLALWAKSEEQRLSVLIKYVIAGFLTVLLLLYALLYLAGTMAQQRLLTGLYWDSSAWSSHLVAVMALALIGLPVSLAQSRWESERSITRLDEDVVNWLGRIAAGLFVAFALTLPRHHVGPHHKVVPGLLGNNPASATAVVLVLSVAAVLPLFKFLIRLSGTTWTLRIAKMTMVSSAADRRAEYWSCAPGLTEFALALRQAICFLVGKARGQSERARREEHHAPDRDGANEQSQLTGPAAVEPPLPVPLSSGLPVEETAEHGPGRLP